MMDLTFNNNQFDKLEAIFRQDIQSSIVTKALDKASLLFDNKLPLNLQREVYSIPNLRSKRKGFLLRGRKVQRISKNEIVATSNPQFAGADNDYSSFVNKGNGRSKAKPFFDKTYEQIKKEIPNIMNDLAKNYLKK